MPINKKNNGLIEFKLKKMQFLSFYLDNSPNNLNNSKDHPYTTDISVRPFYSITDKILGFEVEAKIFIDKDKQDLCCSLKMGYVYIIKEFNMVIIKSKKKTELKMNVIKPFAGQCINTTRGILFVKTQGTFLEDVYLPFVNINNLFEPENVQK